MIMDAVLSPQDFGTDLSKIVRKQMNIWMWADIVTA